MKNLDIRIAGKYQLQRRIGGGGFGDVYIGTKIDTGEDVAIKLEHVYKDQPFLEAEVDVYRSLAGGIGIPRVHEFLFECEYNVMVFDLLGPSLEDLFNFCSRRFSLKTVLMLADQLLHRLEFIHSKDVIHRDVKPENFLMGTGRYGNRVYITDLGLATERREIQIKADPAGAAKRHLIGTARFASINGHLGILQDRCDDLESLGYMLLYFLRGSLPWQGLTAKDHAQKDELILEKKKTISTKDLCRDLPREFLTYFDHIRSLEFDERPVYAYLRKIFRNLFTREGFERDYVFDWTILKYLMDT
ncbi:serine/threonine protein kinase [Sticta canariensis]|nr:serine/threonine protein kinase [Sticta canariensis]